MNAALDKHEGCNIHGWLEVQRVAGNFHLSVHADHYFAMRSVCYCLLTPAQQPLLSSLPAEIWVCCIKQVSGLTRYWYMYVHHVTQAIAHNLAMH